MYRKSGSRFSQQIFGFDISVIVSRLDALLMVAKSCRGWSCMYPWKVLHPDGDVRSLKDALRAEYDAFYLEQIKVSFDYCEAGYIIDAEGPQQPNIYRDGLQWHHWT